MRAEDNPLDLNNFPDDYVKEGKRGSEDITSPTFRRKKRDLNDGKEECGKVYECRFCSLKFCKSQALGGHMNRHRQERETETLNRARQLVYNSEIPATQPTHHPVNCHPMPFLYTTPSRQLPPYSSSRYPPQHEYYVGHAMNSNHQYNFGAPDSTYACVGAPIGLGGFAIHPTSGSKEGAAINIRALGSRAAGSF